MTKQLPTFNGYTVDVRLKEFRKVLRPHRGIEFVSFKTPEGEALLEGFIKTLDAKKTEDFQLLSAMW